jgi:glycosyltransferase involved in cell wall biosynthesis
MRVGLKLPTEFGLQSGRRMYRWLYEALSARHELVFLPPEYPYVSEGERARMAEELVAGCDVLLGLPESALLAARRRLGSDVPFLFFAFGDIPMGAFDVQAILPDLTTRDVFLATCEAEVEVAGRFFRNLPVRVIPFPFDAGDFYPLDAEERHAARARLRFGDDDRIVLYAGRIALEKSIPTLLRIFDVVSRRVPDAHLVIVGPLGGGAALERFGVVPAALPATFSRLVSRAERPDRIHTFGPTGGARLRELYNIADVTVNLSLNPDECFGLVQLEAIACGTPVVGTAWGGLKDTVAHGESGYQVSTMATPTGVKLDWWEAANRIVALLEDGPARERFREACPRVAQRHSPEALASVLEEVFCGALRGRGRPATPIQATRFGEEFWSVCDIRWPGPAFHRGERSGALYREMVAPFAGVTPAHVPSGDTLEPDQVLTLATAVHLDGEAVRPDHICHPYPVQVPAELRPAVWSILEQMREHPALTVERLIESRLDAVEQTCDAVYFLLDTGLLLRTRAVPGWMDPESVGRTMADPLFTTVTVDRASVDLLVDA